MNQEGVKTYTYAELEQNNRLKEMEVNSLLEITKAINHNDSVEKLFKLYKFTLLGQLGLKSTVVFYCQEGVWDCILDFGVAKDKIAQLHEAEFDSFDDSVIRLNQKGNGLMSNFDVIIPVFHKNNALAYVMVSGLKSEEMETEEAKIRFIQTITNIVIVAIENKRLFKKQIEQEKMKNQLDLAKKVQSMLIPNILPTNDQLEMAAIYEPHSTIGGDYYDYIPINKEEFFFCVADISGKGIAAALLMANFQAYVRVLAKEITDTEVLVRKLNERVVEITQGDKFITAFLGRYNFKNRNLCYINAGHNHPILYHEGVHQFLDQGCTVLGAFEELPFVNKGCVKIAPQSILLTYTDGLTDIVNESNDYFTEDKVLDFIADHSDVVIKDFNNALLSRVNEFKGKAAFIDDISVLSMRIH